MGFGQYFIEFGQLLHMVRSNSFEVRSFLAKLWTNSQNLRSILLNLRSISQYLWTYSITTYTKSNQATKQPSNQANQATDQTQTYHKSTHHFSTSEQKESPEYPL
ncbi:hypothetical protein [Bacillus sp. CHD6a]|uniref:hypothetical protein n=1 Tax=Bacillus sp. CHD6a TaxID=1643452 RepID=UPI0012E27E0C|nr:hypothetical protein [Bacillus sp. CHD6a]